jgi:hypothetical protein
MQPITSFAGLNTKIHLLEAEAAVKGRLLKEQFYSTYESFRPANVLKGTLHDIVSSPNLIENILIGAVSLAAGYFTKKAVVGSSANVFRKLFGTLLQFGIAKVVSRHTGAVNSVGRFISHHVHSKTSNSIKP